MKNLTVIGGKGFIGSHIERSLCEAGYQAIALDSRDCNLLDWENLRTLLDGYKDLDSLVLTASITRLRSNDRDSFWANLRMATHLAKYVEHRPLRQMVYLSSVDVYGLVEDGRKLNEESHLAPDDFYSVSKQVSEFLLAKACAVSGTLLTVFRLSGIYGPGDKDKSTIHKLVSSAYEKGEIVIHGDGTVQRDFVYVADVCRLVGAALEKNIPGIYNVATGKSYSIKTIAGFLKELIPVDFSIRFREAAKGVSRADSLQFDVTKLQRGFPDIQLSDLRTGLSLYLTEAWASFID